MTGVYNIKVDTDPQQIPTILTLPFQLGIISLGVFFLIAFGTPAIVSPPDMFLVGLKISAFDLFVVFLIVLILFALRC